MSEDKIDVEKDGQAVATVLREYAGKLADFNAEMLTFLETAYEFHEGNYGRAAWMLDRFEMINRPLQRMLSRGSGLVENSPITPRTRDELDLRMRDLEAQLYHAERQTRRLLADLGTGKHAQEVAKLRYEVPAVAVRILDPARAEFYSNRGFDVVSPTMTAISRLTEWALRLEAPA